MTASSIAVNYLIRINHNVIYVDLSNDLDDNRKS